MGDDQDRSRRSVLHGSCCALAGQGVLLLGASGSGKSDLLLRLVDRGLVLVADDQVMIENGYAAPPSSLAGLIEIRGLGLLRMHHVSPVPLALVLALDDAAALQADGPCRRDAGEQRLPQPARHRLLGVPMLRIEPFAVAAALKVELALDCLAGRRALDVGALDMAAAGSRC